VTPDLFPLILGPAGALVVSVIANYVLYKMLLKEQARAEKADAQTATMIEMLKEIVHRMEISDERDRLREQLQWERRHK
jgi:hypothetical protein